MEGSCSISRIPGNTFDLAVPSNVEGELHHDRPLIIRDRPMTFNLLQEKQIKLNFNVTFLELGQLPMCALPHIGPGLSHSDNPR